MFPDPHIGLSFYEHRIGRGEGVKPQIVLIDVMQPVPGQGLHPG